MKYFLTNKIVNRRSGAYRFISGIVRMGKFDITEVAINYKKILRTTEF
jgi:hypothetical protein